MRLIRIVLVVGLFGCSSTRSKAAPPSYTTAAINDSPHDPDAGRDSEKPVEIAAAIGDPARRRDAQVDARRHAAELVEFAQVKPGDVVVDLVPGAGYFTRIFSLIVGPAGRVYDVWPEEYARIDDDEVSETQELARDPHYSNVTILIEPAAQFRIPQRADLVWTSQNYHDFPDKFMGSVDMSQLDRSILQALKPGGVFVVVDHAAQPGSGMRDTEAMHRIDPELVKSQVTGAGFKMDGESSVLRNPADARDVIVFDPVIRGHTDQFAFRFRAPD